MTQVIRNASSFFDALAKELDVPESRYEEAIARYKSVGTFLNRDQSALARLEPDVYPQGSFRLGTAIKPIHASEEYDIDLVCEMQASKSTFTQEQLKKLVGKELKLYAEQNGMNSAPDDKRRCWTLEYADDAQFHLDVLPALSDATTMRQILMEHGHQPGQMADKSIAITDKEHPRYSVRSDDWHQSNPRGYADWFVSRMKIRLDERRSEVAMATNKSIEDVPDYKVKTPLQRVVQILKRHRDKVFEENPEHKPISIIITTLAAKVYNNEATLDDALERIVFGMEGHVETRNGVPYIANPVNPMENFADKWAEDPNRERERAFNNWTTQLKSDYNTILGSHDVVQNRQLLESRFGEITISQIIPKTSLVPTIKNSALSLISSVASVLAVPHRQVPRWRTANLYKVQVQVSFGRNGFRDQAIENNGVRLPKSGTLRFEAKTNYDGPHRVYWQVVNTGQQAEKANGLRGGFYEGKIERGGKVRTESTLYEGKHWVECFIVRDGVCLARSGEFIVNIGG